MPRIELNRKRPCHRKIRTKPSLFDPNKVREIYGDKSLTKRNNGWIFRHNEYNGGLLILSVNLFELSNLNVNPTLEEIYLFRASQDRVVVDAAAALASTLKLRINDKVKVVVGKLQGTSGYLTEIHDDGTVTVVAKDEQVMPLKLLRWEICNLFSPGDFVRVLFGEHQGKEGFIVDLEGNTATVYHHVPVAGAVMHTGNMTHSEVYFFILFDISYLFELPSLVFGIHRQHTT